MNDQTPKPPRRATIFATWVAGIAIVLSVAMYLASPGSVVAQMQSGLMHGHGADGSGHDEMTMPGLRGVDASPVESAEIAALFRAFQRIERNVEHLPVGIRTVTYSADPDVMAILVSHVSGMIGRVEEGRDPQIFLQSPTLDILFERGGELTNTIEVTDEGVVVTQTSQDAEVVAALHTHADEVSAMADRGMAAVHEMMMQRAGN